MEPRHFMIAFFMLTLVFAFGALFLMMATRQKTALASFALAIVSFGAFTFTDATDDTPTWRERMLADHGIEVGEVPNGPLDEPGAWEIDGEWRTCYSPNFYDVDEGETILCQPVTPETEFEEVTK